MLYHFSRMTLRLEAGLQDAALYAMARNTNRNAGDKLGELVGDKCLTVTERNKLDTIYATYFNLVARLHVLAVNYT